MAFDAAVRMIDRVAVLDLRGDIDREADDALTDAFEQAVAEQPERVLLNFGEVDYINSTGIALIVGLLARARNGGLEVSACDLTDHYKEIFEITRLTDFVQVFPDEASATAPAAL